jgi:hypothetical protein
VIIFRRLFPNWKQAAAFIQAGKANGTNMAPTEFIMQQIFAYEGCHEFNHLYYRSDRCNSGHSIFPWTSLMASEPRRSKDYAAGGSKRTGSDANSDSNSPARHMTEGDMGKYGVSEQPSIKAKTQPDKDYRSVAGGGGRGAVQRKKRPASD